MLLNVSQQSLRLEKTVVNIIVINDRSNFEFELSTLSVARHPGETKRNFI